MKKKIVITLGTRPEIIRLAPIINKIRKDKNVEVKVVYTGQHYDYLMSDVFFNELNVSPPDVNLRIGSGNHSEQTAKIMIAIEKYFYKYRPDMVVVFGDTNSSLAVALAAVKQKIPLTHLEAGCREGEMDIPEEINRRLIDHCANLLVAVSDSCVDNLKNEKVLGDIYNCGDPLLETFNNFFKTEKGSNRLKDFKLNKKEYIFMTLHRDKNVDDLKKLKQIIDGITVTQTPILFAVHPRTKKQLDHLNFQKHKTINIIFSEPLSYSEVIYITKNARLVITDSGGLQKEAFWCKTPCITIRENTCWPETVKLGGNFLVNANKNEISNKIKFITNNESKIFNKLNKAKNPYSKPSITHNTIKLIKEYSGKSWEK